MGEDLEARTKKIISSLLTSTPLTCTLKQLDRDYQNTIGTEVPFAKMGYNSFEHFLRSIPDTVEVMGRGPFAEVRVVVSNKSAHINELVTKQRITVKKPKGPIRHFPQKRYASLPRVSNQLFQTPADHPKGNYSGYDVGSRLYANNYHKQFATNKYPVSYDNKEDKINYNTQLAESPSESNSLTSSRKQHSSLLTSSKHNISFHPAGTRNFGPDKRPAPKEPKEFRVEKISTDSPHLRSTVESTSATASITSTLNIPHPKPHILSKLKPAIEDVSSVPRNVQNNLKMLVSIFPEGIWCTQMPDEYKKRYSGDLYYEQYGYRSLIDMCIALPHIFHYVRPSSDDFKLYDAAKPLPDTAEKSYTMASSSFKTTSKDANLNDTIPNLDWNTCIEFCAQDIVKLGEEIPRHFVTEDMLGQEVDVVVGEVYDPSKFWLYIESCPLNPLMDDMQRFYKEYKEEYLIPEFLLTEGLYCAHLIFGEFHRALIVNTLPDVKGEVRVLYIDYGTMTRTSSKGMCFLPKKFSELPAQAIRARLQNVSPPEEFMPWSVECTQRFRNLISTNTIRAKISHIDDKEKILTVYLAVTSGKEIYYINDLLVKEGMACYHKGGKVQKKKPLLEITFPPIVKYIHLFPTFTELEYGLAPSTAEMELLNNSNVPLNFCYPQYFKNDRHTDEEESSIIQIAEEKQKSLIKAMDKLEHTYDIEVLLKEPELDFSIFGDIEGELRIFELQSRVDQGNAVEGKDSMNLESVSLGGKVQRIQDKMQNLELDNVTNPFQDSLQLSEVVLKDITSYIRGIRDEDSLSVSGSESSFKNSSNSCVGEPNNTKNASSSTFNDDYCSAKVKNNGSLFTHTNINRFVANGQGRALVKTGSSVCSSEDFDIGANFGNSPTVVDKSIMKSSTNSNYYLSKNKRIDSGPRIYSHFNHDEKFPKNDSDNSWSPDSLSDDMNCLLSSGRKLSSYDELGNDPDTSSMEKQNLGANHILCQLQLNFDEKEIDSAPWPNQVSTNSFHKEIISWGDIEPTSPVRNSTCNKNNPFNTDCSQYIKNNGNLTPIFDTNASDCSISGECSETDSTSSGTTYLGAVATRQQGTGIPETKPVLHVVNTQGHNKRTLAEDHKNSSSIEVILEKVDNDKRSVAVDTVDLNIGSKSEHNEETKSTGRVKPPPGFEGFTKTTFQPDNWVNCTEFVPRSLQQQPAAENYMPYGPIYYGVQAQTQYYNNYSQINYMQNYGYGIYPNLPPNPNMMPLHPPQFDISNNLGNTNQDFYDVYNQQLMMSRRNNHL